MLGRSRTTRTCLALAIALVAAAGWGGSAGAQGELVAVVNAQNSVGRLSGSKVRSFYLGRAKFWDDNVLVRPYTRPPSTDAGRGLFRLLKMTPARYRHHWQSLQLSGRGTAPQNVRSAASAIGAVASDRGGITVLSASEASAARGNSAVRVLPIR